MIRVLVVDDSAVVRMALSRELSRAPDIEVVGTAGDPYEAREQIVSLRPDVLTLDIDMPRMDGLTFLEKLMQHNPLPVVVVSSLAADGSEVALRALDLGAVDVLCKPSASCAFDQDPETLVDRVRTAAAAQWNRRGLRPRRATSQTPRATMQAGAQHSLLVIGASTGGTQAILHILEQLPASCPGTLIVQHMPEQFTAAFARRLDEACAMEVREAAGRERLQPGVALVAAGGSHLVARRVGTQTVVEVKGGPRVHHQRPSVDVLFHSVARDFGSDALGVLLTGMGDDGAAGLLAMRDAGARTLAQDEESCVVFGMPREAIRMGAAEQVVALDEIAGAILGALSRPGRALPARSVPQPFLADAHRKSNSN